jgi:hypothetical protein
MSTALRRALVIVTIFIAIFLFKTQMHCKIKALWMLTALTQHSWQQQKKSFVVVNKSRHLLCG